MPFFSTLNFLNDEISIFFVCRFLSSTLLRFVLEPEIITCKRDSTINFDNAHGENMDVRFFAYGLTAG